jgi:hypothetical protein
VCGVPQIDVMLQRLRLRTMAGLLLCAALLSADNHLTEAEKAAGWTLLFDGRSSTGWLEVTGLPFPDSWTIEDGCLKTKTNPDAFQDLRTREVFGSFELRFDWKISRGGNSGVKYFVVKTDRWHSRTGQGFHARARGAEYQLIDDNSEPDAKKKAGALYGVQAPVKLAARPMGEFNESRLVVLGTHVEHWLNGEKVLEYEASQAPRSFLSLQHHNSEVWFKNVKLRTLLR